MTVKKEQFLALVSIHCVPVLLEINLRVRHIRSCETFFFLLFLRDVSWKQSQDAVISMQQLHKAGQINLPLFREGGYPLARTQTALDKRVKWASSGIIYSSPPSSTVKLTISA